MDVCAPFYHPIFVPGKRDSAPGNSNGLRLEAEFDEDANVAMTGDGRRQVGKIVDAVVFELIRYDACAKSGVFHCAFAVVEDIEELALDIEVEAIMQWDGARDVHVPLLEARTDQAVAPHFIESLGSDRRYNPVH